MPQIEKQWLTWSQEKLEKALEDGEISQRDIEALQKEKAKQHVGHRRRFTHKTLRDYFKSPERDQRIQSEESIARSFKKHGIEKIHFEGGGFGWPCVLSPETKHQGLHGPMYFLSHIRRITSRAKMRGASTTGNRENYEHFYCATCGIRKPLHEMRDVMRQWNNS